MLFDAVDVQNILEDKLVVNVGSSLNPMFYSAFANNVETSGAITEDYSL